MAKTKTNKDGYLAVMDALRKKGYKSSQSVLARLLGYKDRRGVNNWQGEVPEAQALRVSIIIGVPIESIRPETVAEATARLKEIANAQAKSQT